MASSWACVDLGRRTGGVTSRRCAGVGSSCGCRASAHQPTVVAAVRSSLRSGRIGGLERDCRGRAGNGVDDAAETWGATGPIAEARIGHRKRTGFFVGLKTHEGITVRTAEHVLSGQRRRRQVQWTPFSTHPLPSARRGWLSPARLRHAPPRVGGRNAWWEAICRGGGAFLSCPSGC
jgi:hypothetical protein